MAHIKVSDFHEKAGTFLCSFLGVCILWEKDIQADQFFFCDIGKLIQDDGNIAFLGITEDIDDICELDDDIFHAHDINFGTFGILGCFHINEPHFLQGVNIPVNCIFEKTSGLNDFL